MIISEEICALCQRYQAVALHENSQQVTIAVHGDVSQELISALRFATHKSISIEQWPLARLEQAQDRSPSFASAIASEAPSEYLASLNEEGDAPVVQFIDQTLRNAIQRRASDIHFEFYQQACRIRLRIDGVLQAVASPPIHLAAQLIARLKIMGQLDIAERRLPQDGQLNLQLDQLCFSMRIATLPTLYGEKVVLRILSSDRHELPLDQLGMSQNTLNLYTHALAHPQGLILVTGPTGSGKTVTLYSGLRQLNQLSCNICSVEDPVEIPVFGVNQTQINNKTELGFARVLRALLRQDPDVIMIGEIRDQETAEIAVKAAQTGHLVLSTLHTNSACETLARLAQMGIAGYLLAACLKLVIAQRLVRRLCVHCRVPQKETISFPKEIWHEPLFHWQAVGCEHCFGGYYGRIGIYEVLCITPEIQHALIKNASALQLVQIAQQQGQEALLQAGLTLVAQSITSLEELYRVVGVANQDGIS